MEKAEAILKTIDRETIKSEFKRPHRAGGAHGTPSYHQNPQFVCRFDEGGPTPVRISCLLKEGAADCGGGASQPPSPGGRVRVATSIDEENYFGEFTLHALRNRVRGLDLNAHAYAYASACMDGPPALMRRVDPGSELLRGGAWFGARLRSRATVATRRCQRPRYWRAVSTMRRAAS